jgi:hypothetical protein
VRRLGERRIGKRRIRTCDSRRLLVGSCTVEGLMNFACSRVVFAVVVTTSFLMDGLHDDDAGTSLSED